MSTLSDATHEIRRILKYIAITIGVIVFVILFYQAFSFVKNTYFTKPPPPEKGFGEIPSLEFHSDKTGHYKVNTLTGFLPNFGDRALVFYLSYNQVNLLSLDSARKKVRDVQFDSDETKISDILYKWRSSNNPSKTIIYNIATDDFEITSNYIESATEIGNLPTDKEANEYVFDFLSKLAIATDQYDKDKSSITYYKIEQNNLSPLQNANDAQVVKVQLFFKPIDGKEILFSNHNNSDMTFYLIKKDRDVEIAEAHFLHRVIAMDNYSTYPLKTTDEALQDLENGNAKVIGLNGVEDDKEILDVTLSYYIKNENPQFVIPVIVFSGKNFVAYVDGIKSSTK